MSRIRAFMIAGLAVSLTASVADARDARASLRGSASGMVRQNSVAKEHGYEFYETRAEVEEAVARGELVELTGNGNYEVADFVRFPYARPEVRLFVERLAAQYHDACGQPLVVTSLTRPTTGQPTNAHALSVHPAGMAVDLRVSGSAACRSWLESTLLSLERRGVLDAIREYHPPHYHIAVFPGPYRAYVDELLAREAEAAADSENASHEIRTAESAAVREPAASEQASSAGAPSVEPDEEAERAIPLVATMILLAGAGLLIYPPLTRAGAAVPGWPPRIDLSRREPASAEPERAQR